MNILSLMEEVESATHYVKGMQSDAKRITDVLGVIGGIALQPNLLTFNAAIEAARAGEQGRSFAVVVDEIRALTGRIQESTSEINEMLARLSAMPSVQWSRPRPVVNHLPIGPHGSMKAWTEWPARCCTFTTSAHTSLLQLKSKAL